MNNFKNRLIIDKIPLMSLNAGPNNKEWNNRLKEELSSIIKYITLLKETGQDWFYIKSNPQGTEWTGKCWYIYNMDKYEFDFQFKIPDKYPLTPIEIELPQLDGKTEKMYRGGKICLDIHFIPLWAKNCPKFGIAHVLAMGLAPWLAAEIPYLIDSNIIGRE
ncbi:uncharacterized protein CMU_006010 [Cryptosporidium muris RN66]|uniref:Ubiquitin-fold modifier-conjugating enzyme 1 n=1 Tax=Cryptosporidium muris (strain RN66) TaxID=441375 RepID=B6AHI3_CRYMR|nr:uncharacterized protein CMU_006010 [Cryptosporidium muris RN66]EEA07678.1 hypothetical protein, conserved [Cryptosporidium muris RN66]|eukprot:XP_002142027.1 hypothetical protein [Cryptosporidium muris RN66]